MNIPKNPTDGHVLTWYEVWRGTANIEKLTAVYHTCTLWSDYASEPGGADLVDEWMVSRDGWDQYRVSTKNLHVIGGKTKYATRAAAEWAALDWLHKDRARHVKALVEIDARLGELG